MLNSIHKKAFNIFAFLVLSNNYFAQHAISSRTSTNNIQPTTDNTLRFTQNKGQIADVSGKPCPEVLYKCDNGIADIYLRKTGISYVYNNISEVRKELEEQVEDLIKTGIISEAHEKQKTDELLQKKNFTIHRVDMDFEGCLPGPNIRQTDKNNLETIKEGELEGYNNYYYSHCPDGITNVKEYTKVTYKNIYDNIDVAYYASAQAGIKYDIIVKPHADPHQIKLHWSGADNIFINNEGHLVIQTSLNKFTESIPKVYQNINGKIVDVKARYAINGTTVSFELGTLPDGRQAWDPEHSLVIDPWVTYYGGNGGEYGCSVTNDPAGNVLLVGYTASPNFPTSVGAFQFAFGGGTGDAFVVKMDPAGNRLYATHIGGTLIDLGRGITCDNLGNTYITGRTVSTDFPVGAILGNVVHQNTQAGGSTYGTDAYLFKLDPAGMRLWATYYGGTKDEHGYDVTTDGSNVYLYGETESANAIATVGSFQPAINGTAMDVFVAKFAANGALVWGTYIGGTNAEAANSGITCDATGAIYISGSTSSTNFPVLAGHQMANGGANDAFIFKFSPAGVRLWASYYGGTGSEGGSYGGGITADGIGNIIIVGSTTSTNAIASPGAYQLTNGGSTDTYIVKFNNTGARLWGTFLGGNNLEWPAGVATDNKNNIYVYGEWEDTNAGNYPISACAYQTAFGGVEDQYIAKYDATGKQLCFTYMGGTGEDEIEYSHGEGSICVFGDLLYITGMMPNGYPTTAGSFQPLYGGGGNDAIIAQVCSNICEPKVLGLNYSTTTTCINTMPVTFTPSYNVVCDTTGYKFLWTFTGGTPATSTLPKPVVTYSSPGFYNVKFVLSTLCKKDSVLNTVIVNPCTINASVASASICPGSCTTITAVGSSGVAPYTYSWNTGATTSSINVCPTTATDYSVMVTDANGNFAGTVSKITLRSVSAAVSTVNISCTTSGSATVTTSSGTPPYIYSWSTGLATGPTSVLYSSITGLATGNYAVTVTDNFGCTISAPFTITGTSPASAAFTNPPACVGSAVTFTNTGTTGTYSWNISSPVNVSGTTVNFTYIFLTAGAYSITHSVTTSGCTNTVSQNITVTNCTGPNVTATGSSICPGNCGTAIASGSGGTNPYTYSWSNGGTTQNINPCPVATTTYTVTIRDTGGNTSTSTAVVTVNPAVNIGVNTTNTTCSGGTNGSSVVNPGGGTSPYTYSWSNSQTTQTATGLTQGTYTVKVTDSKGCTSTSTTIITSPPSLIGQFTKGTANCIACGCKEWIMVSATGGTNPYSYSWPDGYVDRYKNNLCSGTYAVKVTDKNGCSINVNLTTP